MLSVAASRIRSAVRRQDLVCRLGGEEFAVYLPTCDMDEAMDVAERIRLAMDGKPIQTDDGSVLATVSIGVTTGPASSVTLERSLSVADKALYQAKSAGRNRVAFAQYTGG